MSQEKIYKEIYKEIYKDPYAPKSAAEVEAEEIKKAQDLIDATVPKATVKNPDVFAEDVTVNDVTPTQETDLIVSVDRVIANGSPKATKIEVFLKVSSSVVGTTPKITGINLDGFKANLTNIDIATVTVAASQTTIPAGRAGTDALVTDFTATGANSSNVTLSVIAGQKLPATGATGSINVVATAKTGYTIGSAATHTYAVSVTVA